MPARSLAKSHNQNPSPPLLPPPPPSLPTHHRKAATPATIPIPIPAAFANAVGCAAPPLLTELDDAVLEGPAEPEGVELEEGVGEPGGGVVLEL